MANPEIIPVRVHAISYGTSNVNFFDLRPLQGSSLPTFSAGAHIDVHMQGGMVRSYSLANHPGERHRYLLGIKREQEGRGGSQWMHEAARVGKVLEVSPPKNHFPLVETAKHTVLIAGGIGITPIWCMAQRLMEIGASWELHYRARSRSAAPLLEELGRDPVRSHVHLSFTDDPLAGALDLTRIVSNATEGSHFYCCGPTKMVDAFENACSAIEADRVHFEYFASREAPATEGGFTVRLARSGREFVVEPGRTILECLQGHGVAVPYSCQQGVCGECETRVLAGTPDHRDLVLSDAEKESGKTIIVCCSGSRTGSLVLDL
jgi:ferredoxin-NADP reductase